MFKTWIPILILSAFISACTGLGGEPEIVATVPQPTSIAQISEDEPTFPQELPDIENGAKIFAENCTACHGIDGAGEGELVLDGSIPRPPDMTDSSLTGLKTPSEWYNTITNGRIENLMPPWQNALTPQERWDVAFYTYTLPYDDNLLVLGEQVWADKCAGCESLIRLTDLESAINISDVSFGNQVDRDDFDSNLSVDEIQAVAAYARIQSLQNPESIGKLVDASVANNGEIQRGNLSGIVEHGTDGSTVPPDTIVQLQYGNATDGFEFAQTTIADDNTFVFEDIPLSNRYIYNVGAVYRDRLFANTLFEGHDEETSYDQTLTIYDLTDDFSIISISQIDMFIDPFEVQDVGSGLRVTQILRYNNASNRMFTTGRGIGDGREAVTLVQVPVGALITSGEANGRYIIVKDEEDGLDYIIETAPILPGDQHEIILEYFVPYADGAIIDQPFVNPIEGTVNITTTNDLKVVSDFYTLQEENEASENLKAYSGEVTITGDESLVFEVAGNPFATTSDDETVVTTDTLFPILLGSVVVFVILIVAVIIFSSRGNNQRQQVDALIKQIAEIDAMHENGQINHDVYQLQRQDLKAQLTALMQSDPSTEDS